MSFLQLIRPGIIARGTNHILTALRNKLPHGTTLQTLRANNSAAASSASAGLTDYFCAFFSALLKSIIFSVVAACTLDPIALLYIYVASEGSAAAVPPSPLAAELASLLEQMSTLSAQLEDPALSRAKRSALQPHARAESNFYYAYYVM